MNDILTDCDSGNFSLLNLLDLSAAFDTIDHSIVLQRLEISFGVSGTALEWFKSYLSNRHRAVVIKGKNSSDHVWRSSGFCPRSCPFYLIHTTFGAINCEI